MENLPFFRASQTLGAEVSTDAARQQTRHSQHYRKVYSGLNKKKLFPGPHCYQMVRSHYQCRSLTPNRSPRGLIYRLQTKAWTVQSCCQTRRWCSSKPYPPDLLQSSRWCPAITWLEACSRPTSHHMDPSDPPGHGNIGDWCSRAGWGQIVLAANHNGGMLWLIASRHDDDDDDDCYCVQCKMPDLQVWYEQWNRTKLM